MVAAFYKGKHACVFLRGEEEEKLDGKTHNKIFFVGCKCHLKSLECYNGVALNL